jgi:hypothetical protein
MAIVQVEASDGYGITVPDASTEAMRSSVDLCLPIPVIKRDVKFLPPIVSWSLI